MSWLLGPKVPGFGPAKAKILIIGEAPGKDEVLERKPWVGEAGRQLTSMLHEAGLNRFDCYLTHMVKYRPPNNDIASFFEDDKMLVPKQVVLDGLAELDAEVAAVQPNLIIALGDHALWACRGHRGIGSWRGSILASKWGVKMLPTYHPNAVNRKWANREIAIRDLRRAQQEWQDPEIRTPEWRFITSPDALTVVQTLKFLLAEADKCILPLAVDLETWKRKYIACVGIAWSELDAICIPFMHADQPAGYWTPEEEVEITWLIQKLLTHPRVSVSGHNFSYDQQYFAREWGYVPRNGFDTMTAQHVLFSGRPKSLAFISSMYCKFHQYWKEDVKEVKNFNDTAWIYNCRDCVATFECREVLVRMLEHAGLWSVYNFRQKLDARLLRVMFRGIGVIAAAQQRLEEELTTLELQLEHEVNLIVDGQLNPRSPLQMQAFFYKDMKVPPVIDRDTGRPTCDDEALETIMERDPILAPLVRRIQSLRSLHIYRKNFVEAKVDSDRRMRCHFGVTGTSTYRLNATKNAFDGGCNMQTIPSGTEDDEKVEYLPGQVELPNVRKMFGPKPGYTIADVDLAGADAQVVAWRAGDEKLKSAFRAGLKIHKVNAKDLFGDKAGPNGDRQPYYKYAKVGVHATNYFAKPRRLAHALKISEGSALMFQSRWFFLHPEIKQWHEDTVAELSRTRTITNPFGYRRHFADRLDNILPEALAWEPQSVVAHVSEFALVLIEEQLPEIEVLLQVHDSLVFEYPTWQESILLPKLYKLLHSIRVPYADPLIIPWGLKTSTISWGDCAARTDLGPGWTCDTTRTG